MPAPGSDIALANVRGSHLAFPIPVNPQVFSQGHLTQRPLDMKLPIISASCAISRDSAVLEVLNLSLYANLGRDLHLGQGEFYVHAEAINQYTE